MSKSISKDAFLINNPQAVQMNFTEVCAEELGQMMADIRFFVEAYVLIDNEYKVLCHV